MTENNHRLYCVKEGGLMDKLLHFMRHPHKHIGELNENSSDLNWITDEDEKRGWCKRCGGLKGHYKECDAE